MDTRTHCDFRRDIAYADAHFKASKFADAYRAYAKALIVFAKEWEGTEQSVRSIVEEVQLPCLLRLVTCKLKLNADLDIALAHCNAALTLCPNSAKAFYKRAQIRMSLRQYEHAAQDLISAAKLNSGSRSIQQAWVQLKSLQNKKPIHKPVELSLWLELVKGLVLLCRSFFSQ
jgi:tetratricopeptide (TPR) repeat protein